MNQKKIIPSIYIKNGKAVGEVTGDPFALAAKYNNQGADAILIFDCSNSDQEHEEALGIIKTITEQIDIPVFGGSQIERMEDVKKLLYAGCKKAVLDYSKESNIVLTEEVSKKFGKEKIVATINGTTLSETAKSTAAKYVSEFVSLTGELPEGCDLPVILILPDLEETSYEEKLQLEVVSGIGGIFFNQEDTDFFALKYSYKEKGIPVCVLEPKLNWNSFKLNSDGMLPVVVQDYKTNEVLMVAYMNQESFELTIHTGRMTYYSRSRQELWVKGLTSGHFQYVKALSVDCDYDTLLAKVHQIGAACHTGSRSCFFNEVVPVQEDSTNPYQVLEDVYGVIMDRKIHPKDGSYTNYLFDKGIDKILKKVGEEATEIVIAAKNPNPEEIKYEISDFLYHVMVLMAERGVTWEEIMEDLAKR